MSAKVLQMLEGRIAKEKIALHLKSEVKDFDFLVKHMQKEVKTTSWKAAWIIHHTMKNDDERLQNPLPKIIKSIKGKTDGHQRELIKIIRKMKLSEDNEGLFFDVCMEIWVEVNKQPAVRYYCGLHIIEMAKKYPEIKNELDYLTTDYYTQTLSPGIKKIFERELAKVY
jgi:hypothetical protein